MSWKGEMNLEKGLLIVVLSPSGGGKGSILKEVMKENPNMKFSVSATTRPPRPGEEEGVHYFFTVEEDFQKMVDNNDMLEYARYCGNYYGTPRKPVEDWLDKGIDVILEIEVQGGEQVKERMPDCVSVFIMPPSMEILESRLRRRGTESDEVIKNRISTAYKEIPFAHKCDYIVVNADLKDAVDDFNAIIRSEKLKSARNNKKIEGVVGNA